MADTPNTDASGMPDAVHGLVRRIASEIPFILHVSCTVGGELHDVIAIKCLCLGGVQVEQVISQNLWWTLRYPDTLFEVLRRQVVQAVVKTLSTQWLATKEDGGYTAIVHYGDFQHIMGVPLKHGRPLPVYHMVAPAPRLSVQHFSTELPTTVEQRSMLFECTGYDPLTRVAEYRLQV